MRVLHVTGCSTHCMSSLCCRAASAHSLTSQFHSVRSLLSFRIVIDDFVDWARLNHGVALSKSDMERVLTNIRMSLHDHTGRPTVLPPTFCLSFILPSNGRPNLCLARFHAPIVPRFCQC